MNAEQIESIINAHLDVNVGRIDLPSFVVFPRGAFDNAINLTAYYIAQAMAEEAIPTVTIPEPPEPPKTILPDMSGAEYGTYYLFLAENGQTVAYWRTSPQDSAFWRLNGDDGWFSAVRFMEAHPHLGHLRKAVPGEVAL